MNDITLTIEPETLLFKDDNNSILVETNFGYSTIESRFFAVTLSQDTLEYAINFIEDELQKIHKLFPREGFLKSSSPVIQTIFSNYNIYYTANSSSITIQEFENFFSKCGAALQGRSVHSLPFSIDSSFMASLLLVREILHHLQFTGLQTDR